jgi:hypothetical protein
MCSLVSLLRSQASGRRESETPGPAKPHKDEPPDSVPTSVRSHRTPRMSAKQGARFGAMLRVHSSRYGKPSPAPRITNHRWAKPTRSCGNPKRCLYRPNPTKIPISPAPPNRARSWPRRKKYFCPRIRTHDSNARPRTLTIMLMVQRLSPHGSRTLTIMLMVQRHSPRFQNPNYHADGAATLAPRFQNPNHHSDGAATRAQPLPPPDVTLMTAPSTRQLSRRERTISSCFSP